MPELKPAGEIRFSPRWRAARPCCEQSRTSCDVAHLGATSGRPDRGPLQLSSHQLFGDRPHRGTAWPGGRAPDETTRFARLRGTTSSHRGWPTITSLPGTGERAGDGGFLVAVAAGRDQRHRAKRCRGVLVYLEVRGARRPDSLRQAVYRYRGPGPATTRVDAGGHQHRDRPRRHARW